ncbi:type I secretion protein [Aureimonas sp. SA4125]|uniref:type I secretion system permease/ATPase n=1 Tax=Aureimonas sp. SA4125 TaxID=2826993 RepID=UPI001CC39353|nr:type I secretion system permease/ATPase [Aureimonas sp. SA4125]BDA83362.1 type I secretion protein [Aureimonas sp. SA4125]
MQSELSQCLAKCRGALLSVGILSGVANILALTGSIFMLVVYDRVIPSGSVPTLVSLGLIALAIYGFQAYVDITRSRMLTRIGLVIKESFSARIYSMIVRNAASGRSNSSGVVRDLDQIHNYLSSMGPTALFDLPWIPIYLGICFAFNFYIGISVLCGALVLVGITIISDIRTKGPSRTLNEAMNKRSTMMQASQNNAETLQSMGMTLAMAASWNNIGSSISKISREMADTTSTLGTLSRISRLALQSFVLGVGAYLVINQEATGGIMIASSILAARALAPIEMTIGHWKNLVSARQSWKRLDELFSRNPPETVRFALPAPEKTFSCEGITLAPPNVHRIIVRDVSFRLRAGEGLGIIGATGSGKSTLVRALVGLWPAVAGVVRLDGVALSQWSSTERGRFIGYLPQNVSLFEGTIAQNISRFDPNADAGMIANVAREAGVHDMITRLPEGYDTMIGENGGGLSGGQSQRIGLARALYGDPFLIILDEPNSNLDSDGEAALVQGMEAARARGAVLVIVAHRPSVLSAVNYVMIMSEGRMQRYGPRDEILELLSPKHPPAVVNAA